MQIRELAKRAAVDVNTVRLYEQQGLLPRPLLPGSDYRIYEQDDVQRLRFIRQAIELGFTVDEVSELLELSDERREEMTSLMKTAESRLQALEDHITRLKRLRVSLRNLLATCPEHGSSAVCQILAAGIEG
jgi:MerR family copper efflux transcriptional regulator